MRGGPADWRAGGRSLRVAAAAAAAAWLSVCPSVRLSAQVGHDPARSPYRDILGRQGVTLKVAHLGGSRGRYGVGVAGGTSVAATFDVWLSNALRANFSLSHSAGTRFVLDSITEDTVGTEVDTVQHRGGPYDVGFLLADAQLTLSLTGAKTWHGLAPYVGFGLGLAFGTGSAPDSTGYTFGQKLTLTPTVGTRLHLGRHVTAVAELRDVIFSLRYPLVWRDPRPAGIPFLGPADRDRERTHHPLFTLGVGWTF